VNVVVIVAVAVVEPIGAVRERFAATPSFRAWRGTAAPTRLRAYSKNVP